MVRWAAIGFTATVSLLIPATWHRTAADLPEDGALVKPPLQSFKVNGVEVKVEIDRGAVVPGGDVHLKIVAIADKPQRLGLVVREQVGDLEPMERVERVPQTLSKRSISVEAAPDGGKPTELSFTLPKARGKRGGVKQYNFLVEPRKAVEGDDGEMTAAMVSVITEEPEAYSIRIEPPAHITPGKAFDVAVRVKNPGKKKIDHVFVQLSPAAERLEVMAMGEQAVFPGSSDDWTIAPSKPGDDEDGLVVDSLAPGEERVLTYHVEPQKQLGRFPIMASAYSEDAGNALDWKAVEVGAAVAAK